MLRLLLILIVLLSSTPAFAQVDFLFTPYESSDADAMARGTVAFEVDGVAYFASSEATYAVEMKGKKPRVTKHVGHPPQAHHKRAESIALGSAGALVILVDDRKRLSLVRFDPDSNTWAKVERPIGFVPREHALVGRHVVFPQTTRSPAWYTYDTTSHAFERVERPQDATRCYGNTFGDGPTAVVAGLDDDGKACAVRFDPVKKTWSDLAAPPVVPGPRKVSVGSSTFLIGPLAATVGYRKGTWTEHVAAPDLGADSELTATPNGVVAWSADRGTLAQWVWYTSAAKWTARTEDVKWTAHLTTAITPDRWLTVATVGGKKALLDVIYVEKLGAKRRTQNRALSTGQDDTTRDWSKASEDEKQKAIQSGLGAVERYVPPELDDKGKVTTKGAWVFALGEELVVWPVPPKKCAQFLDRMLAQWPTTTVGTKWKVERGNGFARTGKKVLYGPSAQCRDTAKCSTDFFSERVSPLSQVGPIFSFTTHTSSSTCETTNATERWTAIDLRSGQPASLTAVIKEESIVRALRSHKRLGKVVGDAATLEAALEALRKVDPHVASGYAFGSWRSATRQVQLRLEFHPQSADIVKSINLWVEPKDEFLEVFEEAARMPDRYMSGS